MSNLQTDNDEKGFTYKVSLRMETIKPKQKILDCFSGNGFIWNRVKEISKQELFVTEIDKRDDKTSVFLKGDNIKFLKALDVSKYDVIDLDSYGIPYEQLEVIFKKQYTGIVHLTFIQSGIGRMNNGMLNHLGYTKQMVKKCPILFAKEGYAKFLNYLSTYRILKINGLSLNRKHYLYFKLDKKNYGRNL